MTVNACAEGSRIPVAAPVRYSAFRTPQAAEHTLQLHERVVRAYADATVSLPSAPPEIRKARSLSQQPPALERVAHQMIRLRALGATIAELRAIPLMLDALLDDLASPTARGRLVALLREGRERGHDGALTELDAFAGVGTPSELLRLAHAKRAEAAVSIEIANEAEKEARELEGAHS